MEDTQPILAAWRNTLRAFDRRPAVVATDGTVLRSFAEIEADALAWTGLPDSGTVVAVQIGNSPRLPGILLALWRQRCIPVLLDSSLSGAARESALATCGAGAILEGDTPLRPVATGKALLPGTDFLKLTSGTSGAARAICFTAGQLLADCESICDTMGITPNDLNYGVIPWSHSYGFSNLITPLLIRGIPLVATEDRLPRAILSGLASSKATVFPSVPVIFQKLAEIEGDRPEALRLCISAGAPLPMATANAFRQRFGLKIHGFYGSSECGGIAYDASGGEVPEGCVGEPMRGVDLRQNESRIEVRSAAVGAGYYPEPDLEVLGGGRFVPGDLLERQPEGFVITGRVSDFINVAGRKLNPADVENVLRGCPGVSEAVVFGVPHPSRGEEPIACVIGTASPEELQAQCARALPSWQCPRDFWIVAALPVNERGKWSRRGLAEIYCRLK